MFSLDNHTFEMQCPNCNFYNPFYFKQAVLRDIIICRGCKYNIRLDDQMNECKKTKKSIKCAIQKLEDSLGDIDITINF